MALRETVSDVLLETLQALGMRFIFANLGTDYPPLVESLAKYGAAGAELPQIILCPHENTAISAAHGAFLAAGRGQGVFVHVGVGTQNLGGALHQAWTGRIPMLIFAGRTPATTRGELLGSRDNYIHYLQDVRDQPGTIRQFCKWEFALELPQQIAYALQRGARVMHSEPPGAIYVSAGREVLSMPAPPLPSDPPERYAVPTLGSLAPATSRRLAEALQRAERPLILASYLGRRREAVEVLVALSEALQVPVAEPFATHLNFPRNHPHHWGFRADAAVKESDLILLLETDVPWIPKMASPQPGTTVVQLDSDPVKSHMILWDFPVTESHQVNVLPALIDLLAAARTLPAGDSRLQAQRRQWLAQHLPPWPGPDPKGRLTVTGLAALLREQLGPDVVVFDEGVSNADAVRAGTRCTRPGGYFGMPGGSLGWGGGAALGYKLMAPQAEVAWVVGDGSFIFSVPSSLYMTAQRYRAPFLTVILNNGGWRAVKTATDRMYGASGHAARTLEYQHRLGPVEHLEQVAAAFGCHVAEARNADQFIAALQEGRRHVALGQCSVINAMLDPEGQ